MSKPIRCAECRDLVGAWTSIGQKPVFRGKCPGYGKHNIERIRTERSFLRVECWNIYHDTGTRSHWFEFTGEPNGPVFWIAKILTPGHDLFMTKTREWSFGLTP